MPLLWALSLLAALLTLLVRVLLVAQLPVLVGVYTARMVIDPVNSCPHDLLQYHCSSSHSATERVPLLTPPLLLPPTLRA